MSPSAPLADVLEKTWQAQVTELARTLGWKVFHPYDSRRSAHGWPDLSLLRERLILVELKTEKGRVSVHQRAWLEALLAANVEAYVARPRHLEDLARILGCRGHPGHTTSNLHAASAHYRLRTETRKEIG